MRSTVHPEHKGPGKTIPHPSFNLSAPVGWVTCYPPMVLTSDDGLVRNELRTLRFIVTHQPFFYQKPSPYDYAQNITARPRLPRRSSQSESMEEKFPKTKRITFPSQLGREIK